MLLLHQCIAMCLPKIAFCTKKRIFFNRIDVINNFYRVALKWVSKGKIYRNLVSFLVMTLIIILCQFCFIFGLLFKSLDMWGQIQRDFGKNCLSYLWPINVAVLDINTTNETKLSFYILQRQSSSKDAITKMIWEKIFILRGKMEKKTSPFI